MSLAEKLAAERRGRLAAERLLELKQAELYAANRKLGLHARALSEEIVETRAEMASARDEVASVRDEVASVRDENRRVKSDLTVANKKIEVAERRLWHSLQTIQDGFAFFDSDDRLISANEAYMVVFDGLEEVKPGIPYAKILQILTEEGIVNPGNKTGTQWRAHMQQNRQLASPEPVVIRLWNDQYIKLVDHRSSAGDLISLGLNITATVRHERELREAMNKSEMAARAKSAFLANMSHEIRTPMNGVVGMAEILADSGLSEEQQLYVDTIRNSGEALLVIINDILDYSKIEADKMVLHLAPLDLESSIHEVLMLLQPAAREKGVRLILDYDLFLPQHFVGDVGRIRQILTNLVGNAVKFTPEGHVLVRVTGAPMPGSDATSVHIAIEDTGIGIPEDKINHIFGEFTQVEDERNRKFEGTGLGLAISKKLVDLMGGEIWVTSEDGVGSCFGFKIPLEETGEGAEMPQSLPEQLKRVMIVDDNATNRGILSKQLEILGIKVDAFPGGAEAFPHAEDGYDLMIIDHQMPDLDGPELVTKLRASGNTVPIVIFSSNPGCFNDPVVRSQVSAVLTRPLPRDKLMAALAELGASLPTEPEKPNPDAFEFVSHQEDLSDEALQTAADVEAEQQEPELGPRKMRILAAEDNKTNQLVFRKMIKTLDIELQIANNGREAVETYQSFQPDMIFMDISMPEMDGKEATQAIRQLEEGSGTRVPIVALTAHAMEGDSHSILAAGLDHYLTKPLRKPAILDKIAELVPEGVDDPFPPEAQVG